MSDPAVIRRFATGDEASLLKVYVSAIHRVAGRDYTAEQIQAWAPADIDALRWQEKMRAINPFVAEWDGALVGYADVQPDGYIDHFFVSGWHPRRGIGSLLMRRVLAEAASLGVATLTSDVCRTAQPFFERFGFVVIEQRTPVVRGVVVPNARMSRSLGGGLRSVTSLVATA